MDDKLLLTKAIGLLYRESQLLDKCDNSQEVVRSVIDSIIINDLGIGINSDQKIISNLKETAMLMVSYPYDHEYDVTELLQRIRVNVGDDDRLYEVIRSSIEPELEEANLKRRITNLRKQIHHHFREQEIKRVLSNADMMFKFKRNEIKDVTVFLQTLSSQLETLATDSTVNDVAIIEELDIGDDEGMDRVFETIAQINSGALVYKLGSPELNEMLQGGLRPGETWNLNGLQHKFKTGFSLEIFADVAIFNTPILKDPTKKPLLLRITFEDPLEKNIQFLYQYLKFSETRVFVDVRDMPVKEMSQYVKQRLQETGFHVKMLQVDPHGWTIKSIMNKVLEYEAQGYEIKVLGLDYLYKVPTAGCITTTVGSDVMDALSRMRNFCASKGIVLVNPHQLSTEAKNLLRSGIPEDQFPKEMVGKGYFEGSKGLDRIYDGGLIFHLFKYNKETYFAIALDKHRLPTIVDDDKRYVIYKFPKGMPLPYAHPGERLGFRKLSHATAGKDTNDELFAI